MPGSLKRALVREVARRESNLNDVAVALLAERFGIPFAASGRRRKAIPGAAGAVVLRMPPELRRELKAAARRRQLNVNDLVLAHARVTHSRSHSHSNRKDTMASTNGSSNGKTRGKDKVRVAIVGVGNCANSLVQGVQYYKDAPDDQFVPGLMHVNLGGYHVSDIEFTAAFDVTTDKVGKDLADAIWAHPNDTIKFADVPKTGITVNRGMTHDGLGKYISEVVTKAPGETDDIVGILQETKTDVVVSYLPVGSEAAAKWYAEQCLEAGVALVNCMPVFIAREAYWQKRFEEKGLPIIGDDIKSQVGATITHRVLTSLFRERGVHLDRTMQLNVGGNSDFLNMLERTRLESKKISKTNAVTSMLDYDMGEGNVHVGPSDYVPWLTDRKWAFIRMEGTSFGDVPLNIELKLEVWDSPNSAGIVIDAVRMAKLALNNGIAGALEGPSSYLMKSPPVQIVDDEAYEATEKFIAQNALKKAKTAAYRLTGAALLNRGGGAVGGARSLHDRRALLSQRTQDLGPVPFLLLDPHHRLLVELAPATTGGIERLRREAESGTECLPHLGVDEDVAAGLGDDAVGGREAEAGPLPHLLRREERLEHAAASGLVHAAAGVLDGHTAVDGRRHAGKSSCGPSPGRRRR